MKITHLLHALPPSLILDFTGAFDRFIMPFCWTATELHPNVKKQHEDQPATHLSPELRVFLAQDQVRLPECEGGLGIISIANADKPAFYVATVLFLATPHGQMLVTDPSSQPLIPHRPQTDRGPTSPSRR